MKKYFLLILVLVQFVVFNAYSEENFPTGRYSAGEADRNPSPVSAAVPANVTAAAANQIATGTDLCPACHANTLLGDITNASSGAPHNNSSSNSQSGATGQ